MAEREELSQLRKENRQLRLEREILKNAAAFFVEDLFASAPQVYCRR
jgi:transposase